MYLSFDTPAPGYPGMVETLLRVGRGVYHFVCLGDPGMCLDLQEFSVTIAPLALWSGLDWGFAHFCRPVRDLVGTCRGSVASKTCNVYDKCISLKAYCVICQNLDFQLLVMYITNPEKNRVIGAVVLTQS
jgi:hypothetical protein